MDTLAHLGRYWPEFTWVALSLVLCWRLLRSMLRGGHPRGTRNFRLADESATVMLDFTLVFPLFIMILLVVIQVALMVNANLMVTYAAFAATRSAIVSTDGGLDEAELRATRAAALVCSAISPALADGRPPDHRLYLLVLHTEHTGLLPGSKFARRLRRLGGKYAYAEKYTHVEVLGADPMGHFETRVPVTATVTYDFHLNVPYAGALMAAALGKSEGGFDLLPISESYTFLNEGRASTPSRRRNEPCKGLAETTLDLLKRIFM